MTRPLNIREIRTRLMRSLKVADVEDEALDDGRFFVHLREGWDFGSDPWQRIGTRSFGSVREADAAVRAAKKVEG